jgi:hypothetical protein
MNSGGSKTSRSLMVSHLVTKQHESNSGSPAAESCRDSCAKRNLAVIVLLQLCAQRALLLQCSVKQIAAQSRNRNVFL